jgi:hypothetical protein
MAKDCSQSPAEKTLKLTKFKPHNGENAGTFLRRVEALCEELEVDHEERQERIKSASEGGSSGEGGANESD